MTKPIEPKKNYYGLVLGRFQPLHLGHMEYLDAARERSSHLAIGITNPDKHMLIYDSADPKRSRPDSNPFSYFDRQRMISASLVESGWEYETFSIVPAAINKPQDMKSYLPPPACTTAYITVYDEWGDRKADLISGLGYAVDILWRRDKNDRLTSGTAVRDMISSGRSAWRELVPRAVSRYLDENGWSETLSSQPGRRARVAGTGLPRRPAMRFQNAPRTLHPSWIRHQNKVINVLDVRSGGKHAGVPSRRVRQQSGTAVT